MSPCPPALFLQTPMLQQLKRTMVKTFQSIAEAGSHLCAIWFCKRSKSGCKTEHSAARKEHSRLPWSSPPTPCAVPLPYVTARQKCCDLLSSLLICPRVISRREPTSCHQVTAAPPASPTTQSRGKQSPAGTGRTNSLKSRI